MRVQSLLLFKYSPLDVVFCAFAGEGFALSSLGLRGKEPPLRPFPFLTTKNCLLKALGVTATGGLAESPLS